MVSILRKEYQDFEMKSNLFPNYKNEKFDKNKCFPVSKRILLSRFNLMLKDISFTYL